MNFESNILLAKLIEFLKQQGTVLQDSFDPNCFGNQIYLFECRNMFIRVIREKGIWSIEIASKFVRNGEFHDFSYLVSAVQGNDEAMDINEKSGYFIEHYMVIASMFSAEHYRETIELLRSKRLDYLKKQPWHVSAHNADP